MSRNGEKRDRNARPTLQQAAVLRVIYNAYHTPQGIQLQALAWMRGWRQRPDRIFWQVLPTGGRRLV